MKHCLAAFLTAALLLSCAREEIIPTEPDTSTELEVADNYISGEVRVYLSEELTALVEEAAESGTIVTKSSDMNNALSELGITEMTRLFPHAGEYEERTRREGLHRWYVVKYSQSVPLTKAQTSLEMVDGIEIFEPVMPAKINDFNDLSEDLWGMYNRSNPGFDINVRPVWNEYTTGNPKVVVCVVDAGIDLNTAVVVAVPLFDHLLQLGALLIGVRVKRHAAYNSIIQRIHIVALQVLTYTFVSTVNQLGICHAAGNHGKQLGNILLSQRADFAVGVGMHHGAHCGQSPAGLLNKGYLHSATPDGCLIG